MAYLIDGGVIAHGYVAVAGQRTGVGVRTEMQRVRKEIGAEHIELKSWQRHGITVAVLDTGMAVHPDLEGRQVAFFDFVKGKGREATCYDDNGHGTHVCGILCGNGRMSDGRYRGIAPDCRLVVCKVLDHQGDGCMEQMLQGLLFVEKVYKEYDIRAVNISVGIGQLKDQQKVSALAEAVHRLWKLGMVVVCAAGNKGPGDNTISAIGLSEKIIMVGCHDGSYRRGDSGSCSLYSGRGPRGSSIRKPDLVAPGTDIMSCNAFYQRGKRQEYYTAKSGTSMATPIVTGCASLLLQKEPYLTNGQVRERLIYSARDMGAPWNQQGWGMVNLEGLLE